MDLPSWTNGQCSDEIAAIPSGQDESAAILLPPSGKADSPFRLTNSLRGDSHAQLLECRPVLCLLRTHSGNRLARQVHSPREPAVDLLSGVERESCLLKDVDLSASCWQTGEHTLDAASCRLDSSTIEKVRPRAGDLLMLCELRCQEGHVGCSLVRTVPDLYKGFPDMGIP
jgi:hypothetical protein